MLWLKGLALCEALLLVHCYIPYFKGRCKADQEDDYSYEDEEEDHQPQPPKVGQSYIAKYEMNSFFAKHSAWTEEYFDYRGKRAKISVSVLGMEFVDLYDYARGTVTSYRLQRPEKSGWSSTIEDTCRTVEMSAFRPTFPLLSYPFSMKAKPGPQTMSTSNRALKYGPPYNYTFRDTKIGAETRNIPADVFRGCINEGYLNYSLTSDFYWGKDLPSSYPSGEPRIPLFIEMRGPHVNDALKEAYVMKYVPWFQDDPEFTSEMFEIPKGLHCEYLPRRSRLPNMPLSFSYSFEETQFQLDGSGFLRGGFRSTSYRQVWYDNDFKLARIDMRPTAEDLKELNLPTEDGAFEFISLLFDLRSGYTYFSDMVTSECLSRRKDITFFWKHKNGTLKSPEEFFDINSRLQYKGKTTVMGIEAEVWTELIKDSKKGLVTRRDLSFSTEKKRRDTHNNVYVFSLLQESVYTEKNVQDAAVRQFPVQNATVRNYLEFDSYAPEHHVFGRHACIPEEPSGSYYINFKPLKYCTFDAGSKLRFLAAFRNELASAVNLSTALPLRNFTFRWINEQGISVGFTFTQGILGETIDEAAFSDSARKKALHSSNPLKVSYHRKTAQEPTECVWQSVLFHKHPATQPQPDLKKCRD